MQPPADVSNAAAAPRIRKLKDQIMSVGQTPRRKDLSRRTGQSASDPPRRLGEVDYDGAKTAVELIGPANLLAAIVRSRSKGAQKITTFNTANIHIT